MTIYDASKKYLDTVKGPRTIRQIWEALIEGGLQDINYNAVYTALWRRGLPKGEFERIGEKFWGLTEWNTGGGNKTTKQDAPQKAESGKAAPKGGIRLLETCEAFIRSAGKPVPISALIQHLAELGHKTSVDSLRSNMRKEKRQRFVNSGDNTWGLAEWQGGTQAANPLPPKVPSRPTHVTGGLKLTDQLEMILREAGKPLHGKVIQQKLADKNRPTSSKSLSGAMPQDSKKRFENLGENVWALKEWPESAKEAYRARKESALLYEPNL